MKTKLYDKHVALGGKMIEFAGWEMPVQYKGVIQEHSAVREKAGLFDVSHMGRIIVEGPDAERFLDALATNKIAGKKDHFAVYTVLMNEEGGSVDDAIIYRYDSQHFFIVVNAGNRDKDWNHIFNASKKYNLTVRSRYADDGILALQGPAAMTIAARLFSELEQLKPMALADVSYKGIKFPAARTGYTGSGGCEFYCPLSVVDSLWEDILAAGASDGIEPIGLGARDTLRLESGYALYGHELSDAIAPIESIAAWTVKMDKEDFIGKKALEKRMASCKVRSQYGVVLMEKGIPREGYEVYGLQGLIGKVTSGTHSPTLEKGIAIIMVDAPLEIGDRVHIQIRKNRVEAEVVPLPFFAPNIPV